LKRYTKLAVVVFIIGTGIPLKWIKDAGHNSNTDAPKIINKLIDDFIDNLK
jgi:pimeloyl-ACP methyl ester carboxylesterase